MDQILFLMAFWSILCIPEVHLNMKRFGGSITVSHYCEQFIADIQKATLHENGTLPNGTFTHSPNECCTNTPMSFGGSTATDTAAPIF